jgi:replicative DNA helicase
VTELIIGAQRMGPTGIVPLNFRGDFTRFSGLEDAQQ